MCTDKNDLETTFCRFKVCLPSSGLDFDVLSFNDNNQNSAERCGLMKQNKRPGFTILLAALNNITWLIKQKLHLALPKNDLSCLTMASSGYAMLQTQVQIRTLILSSIRPRKFLDARLLGCCWNRLRYQAGSVKCLQLMAKLHQM